MNRLMFWGMALSFKIRDRLKPPAQVLEPVGIQPGMTVIDYGSGPGSYTLQAAKMVGPTGRVYAIDIDPLAVEAVRSRAARQRLDNVEARLVSSFDTALPADSADRVLLMDMIHYISDRQPLYEEVHRILKPDGILYLDIHHMSAAAAKAELEQLGLFTVTKDRGSQVLAAPRT